MRAILVLGIVAALSFPSAPALGWANGTGGPNSYGTHDWIVNKAIRAVGGRAEWVQIRVALRASDDPDTVDGLDHASSTWWHVWDEWGSTYGGAPEAARVWHQRMRRRLQDGNERGASRALGMLGHIVGDVANPTHTDSTDAEDRMHSLHESAVDTRSQKGDGVYRCRFNGVDPVSPYAKTRSVARTAHRYYDPLVRNYNRHGYNTRVHRITRRQLNRACNALSDLIASASG